MPDRRHSQNLYDRLMELQRDLGETPCERLPDVFFPEDYESVEMHETATVVAKGLCAECPLIKECREWGIVAAIPYGIIGGLTPQERIITPETLK